MKLKPSCIRRFGPAVEQIEQCLKTTGRKPFLVAIDGRCGGGKTTLGYYLQKHFGGNLFHMDDFYLQPHQRTDERLAETGGNVDYERFLEEVLLPVQKKEPVQYRRFCCKTWEMQKAESISYHPFNIIEGSYSLHPYFGHPYDVKIFIDIDRESQLENIRKRNGEEALENFKRLWIPKEEAYFEKFGVEKDCLVIRWAGIENEKGLNII